MSLIWSIICAEYDVSKKFINCYAHFSEDVIGIFDGNDIFTNKIGIFSGTLIPNEIISFSSSITIHFISNSLSRKHPATGTGFKLLITSCKSYTFSIFVIENIIYLIQRNRMYSWYQIFLVSCINSYLRCDKSVSNENSSCIPITKVCDGHYDCNDAFDESDELCKGAILIVYKT